LIIKTENRIAVLSSAQVSRTQSEANMEAILAELYSGRLYLCLECDFFDLKSEVSGRHARRFRHCVKGVMVRDFPITKERVQDLKDQQFTDLISGFKTSPFALSLNQP
jgi:hypothetical protein